MISDSNAEGALFMPRLATDPNYRLRWHISADDLARFDTLAIGDVCVVTELEHGTRWLVRRAACALTEPDGTGCYCDAQAIPSEFPGGFADLPVELEAPPEVRLRALQALLADPSVHPAYRLTFEESAKQLEAELETRRLEREVLDELERVARRLDDRDLGPTDRELLELRSYELAKDLARIGALGAPADHRQQLEAELLAVLTEELEDGEDELGCFDEEHELGGEATVGPLVAAARVAAYGAREGHTEPELAGRAFERLAELVEESCSDCIAEALLELARYPE